MMPRVAALCLGLALIAGSSEPARACLCPGLDVLVPGEDAAVVPLNVELVARAPLAGPEMRFRLWRDSDGATVELETSRTEYGDMVVMRARPVGDLDPNTGYRMDLVEDQDASGDGVHERSFTTGDARDDVGPDAALASLRLERMPEELVDCGSSCGAPSRRALLEHRGVGDVAYFDVSLTKDDGSGELELLAWRGGLASLSISDGMCEPWSIPALEPGDGYCVTTTAVDLAGNRSRTGPAQCAFVDTCEIDYDDACRFAGECSLLEDGGEHPGPPDDASGCTASRGSGAVSGLLALLLCLAVGRARR